VERQGVKKKQKNGEARNKDVLSAESFCCRLIAERSQLTADEQRTCRYECSFPLLQEEVKVRENHNGGFILEGFVVLHPVVGNLFFKEAIPRRSNRRRLLSMPRGQCSHLHH
jgi:hypothetical protein